MNKLGTIIVETPDLGEDTSVQFEFYETGARHVLVAHTMAERRVVGTNILVDVYENLWSVVRQFMSDDNHEEFPRKDEWI